MRTIKISIAVIMLFTFAATGQEPVPNPYSPAKTAGVRMPDNTKVCSPGTEPTTGKVLKFDGTCWDSGTDNTGGGGGSLTVEEADGNPSVSNVEALQFNQASGFSVVDEEAGQVQVNLTITDSLVPNDITASNYCALGGCTFVGNVIFGNLGFTGTASDTNPTCEAGDYRIYADDSETKWKKCQDGVLSDLDTDTDTDTDALVDLTGVSISDPSDGQILQYGSGVWGNVTPPFLKNTGTLDDGEFCVWLSSSSHLNCNVPLGSLDNLNSLLGGINIPDTGTRTNGRICTWDGTGVEIDCNTTNAPTASAFAATPDPCDTASEKAVGIAADGTAICEPINADEVVFDKTGTNFTSSEVDSALKEFGTVDATGPNGDDWLVDWSRLNNVPAFSVPSGANPTVSGASDLAIDTTDQQLVYGSSAVVLTGQNSKCIVVEKVTSADDNMLIASWPDPVTINSVWCQYNGSAPSTAATFTLEDGGGNAMTITGTNPTCTAPGTPPTPAAVTANNTLTAYELLRFDTTNTPDPATDTYLICIGFVYDRQ